MNKTTRDERELLSPPGESILETIQHLRMSQVELAERMGKTPSKVNDIISGKEPITTNTALLLETVLGIDAQFWLNREMQYREKLIRLDQDEFLDQCIGWLEQQPIKELRQCGYIKSDRVGTEMVSECLQFYGVAGPDQWESMYVQDYATANFRRSLAHKTILGAMAAWLRVGEIEIKKYELPVYDKLKFKEAIIELKKTVASHPEDFADRLKNFCHAAGVGVVYTPCFSKAPVSGATRWIGGNPLIQLTDRYKTNDHFWFTFYHEAAHILLHGKKEVFIESFEGHEPDIEKEKEADEFAAKTLLADDFLDDVPNCIAEIDIRAIARKYKTHPGIVIGRLQHLNIVPYKFGSEFRVKVNLDDYVPGKGDTDEKKK